MDTLDVAERVAIPLPQLKILIASQRAFQESTARMMDFLDVSAKLLNHQLNEQDSLGIVRNSIR